MFNFIWNKIELIKIRAFSRINILLIPLISILICFSIKNLIENKINIKILLLFLFLLIILLQVYLIEIVSAKVVIGQPGKKKG